MTEKQKVNYTFNQIKDYLNKGLIDEKTILYYEDVYFPKYDMTIRIPIRFKQLKTFYEKNNNDNSMVFECKPILTTNNDIGLQ